MDVGKNGNADFAPDPIERRQTLLDAGAPERLQEVRFALSNDALKTSGTPARRVISARAFAV